MDAYAAYNENDAVIREGTLFLAEFPADPRRVEVALQVGDVYSRTDQPEKEFALYKSLLKELAAKADGVPLGELHDQSASAYNRSASAYNRSAGRRTVRQPRSGEYAQVLDRYLSRLVAMQRLPDALALLRGELDRNPQDPGLYEKLAQFLEQNRLDEHEEEVYQRAIEQFQSTSLGMGWYGKLARFYLRQRRNADYSALSHKVIGIFSGTDLEEYLNQAPAPDSSLALEVDRYAHDRFPHDLTFVRHLLGLYRSNQHYDPVSAERLLWEHWSESADLRDQLFEMLSSTGRLDAQLSALRQQAPEIDKANWAALAQSNPAASGWSRASGNAALRRALVPPMRWPPYTPPMKRWAARRPRSIARSLTSIRKRPTRQSGLKSGCSARSRTIWKHWRGLETSMPTADA